MTLITVPRPGQPPLRFSGQLIADSDGRVDEQREYSHWHVLELYQTQAGKFVLVVEYGTSRACEFGHRAVMVLEQGEVARVLMDWDATSYVQPYPDRPGLEWKNARMMTDIRRRFARQVSDLLADPLFVENVE